MLPLIELRLAFISYQDQNTLLLTLAGCRLGSAAAAPCRREVRSRVPSAPDQGLDLDCAEGRLRLASCGAVAPRRQRAAGVAAG